MQTFPILLFHPNIPKPLHGLAPREILGEDWWNQTKLEAKAKLDNHCWACGVHKSEAKYHQWLEAHECYSIDYSIGRMEYVGTCALCHACHNYIHDGRLQVLALNGETPAKKQKEIICHGNQLIKLYVEQKGLKFCGQKKVNKSVILHECYPLSSNKIYWKGDGAKWEDYHLILFGERYERPFKNLDDWRNHYAD